MARASARAIPVRRRGRFHTLSVSAVRPLTEAAVEVTFVIPDELLGEFDYFAGQHVALRTHIDGHEVRRSYSLCRPPSPGSTFGTAVRWA